jgi:hypothetical protein
MMVGYDDEAEQIYLHDCGREDVQTLSYDELRRAWNCSYPGLSKPHTVCIVRMNSTRNKYQIAKEALEKKSEIFLNPPVSFVGRKGFQKFIHDLPELKNELSKADYDMILSNMVMFFGTVPTVPNALRGIKEPDNISFGGGFDRMSRVLNEMGTEFEDKIWLEISERFKKGAEIISQIKDVIVAYLTGENDKTDELPGLFTSVMEIMTDGLVLLGK